ncbi:MAG: hypothetical protein CBD97_02285 [Pelagibacteraceae bacterium TMED237]|nr:MAG: hypothetical protein CBD97_02285 [Pelagibacteraceae bacterium TMED237]|tara:strand:+ start:2401 stop:2838 length:438 start_codon:yes stop_codon:yes gene_type:complete
MSEILHIVYGTQTGTAEELAFDIEKLSKEKGFKSEVFELDDITMDKLQEITMLLIVTSTTGDGEVPDNGLTFWENLSSLNELNISNLKYGVLALGDSSHYDFCNAGKIIDEKLKNLGANRIIDRQECDFDTEGSIEWSKKFLSLI